ncbi:MAG TPA: sigma-70 family RNA polymerase sigma factor [Thermoanaerobaculia bacterium]|nr:sigma-70 family RNA polymerase sigma factor [Thermoanaerobaculia bacterium]
MEISRSAPEGREDEALLADLRAGKDEAFARLLREHGGRLLAVSRRLLRNEEDARDAVQEALISAFRSIDRFEGGSRIGTWLHRIAVNCCLMKLRSRQRRPEDSIEDLLPKFVADGHQVEPSVDWAEPIDSLLQRREICALVRQCIDRLPETYRTVLLLRDIEELSTEEAARLVGVTENALKIRLHRARQALRTLLDPHMRGAM